MHTQAHTYIHTKRKEILTYSVTQRRTIMKKQKVEFATRKVENDRRKQRWDCQKSSIFHLSTPSSATQQANHQGRELHSEPPTPRATHFISKRWNQRFCSGNSAWICRRQLNIQYSHEQWCEWVVSYINKSGGNTVLQSVSALSNCTILHHEALLSTNSTASWKFSVKYKWHCLSGYTIKKVFKCSL